MATDETDNKGKGPAEDGSPEPEQSDDCDICCYKFNKKIRKPVRCFKCNFVCCAKCVEGYLMTSTVDLHCMKCTVTWTRAFILKSLNRSFLEKKWRPHHQKILFDRERSQIPTEQDKAVLHRELKERNKVLEEELKPLREESKRLKEKIQKLNHENWANSRTIVGLENNAHTQTQLSEEESRREFIQPCAKPDCEGYLSTNWKCPICKEFTCKDCLEYVGDSDSKETHVCDEALLANAKQIRKDSKKCPGCGIFIHRYAGCLVMFCTKCHTSFWWNSLKIMRNGQLHNPHYYEYMAQRGQGPGGPAEPNPCGPVNVWEIERHIHDLKNNIRSRIVDFHNIFEKLDILPLRLRMIDEIGTYTIRNYQNNDIPKKLRLLRWKYIQKEIDDKTYQNKIYHYEKIMERNNDIRQVLEMFRDCGNDIFRKFIHVKIRQPVDEHVKNIDEVLNELDQLREYMNGVMAEHSLNYGTVTPRIINNPSKRSGWESVTKMEKKVSAKRASKPLMSASGPSE